MLPLLFGIGALVLLLFLARGFVAANPAHLAKRLRVAGGVAAVGLGGLLAFTGRGGLGLPLIAFGVMLLLRQAVPDAGARTQRRPGATSRVRSSMLAMELDLDSGAMRGEVLAGTFAGRSLDSLNEAEFAELAREVSAADPEGASLLETYLDRRMAGGREHFERDAHARHRNPPRQSAMTEDEAYQILGLDPGASTDDIRRTHRTLMQKLHPDRGGSNWLASRINQAKDVLLRGRR